jgi:phage terminase large subunit
MASPPINIIHLNSISKARSAGYELLSTAFPKQIAFILDESRRTIAFCNRRAGKSFAGGLKMFRDALDYPRSTILYMTMTVGTAKKIMHKDILEPLNEKYKLGAVFRNNKTEVQFPNGSIIYLAGVDAGEKQRKKVLGQKPRLVVIDECQDLTIDVRSMVDLDIGPALVDHRGQLVMIGTPGEQTRYADEESYWYEITKEYKNSYGWSFHSWSSLDNPHVAPQIQEEIRRLTAINPAIESKASFIQSYLGKWAVSTQHLVYHPNEQTFDLDELPEGSYTYVLGVDLGFKDDDAFIVGAWRPNDPTLYIVEAHKQTGNDDIATGLMIRRLNQRYAFARIVIDAAALKSVETMRQRMGLPLIGTPKTGKTDIIKLMNADFDVGLIKVLPQPREVLEPEWKALVWNVKKARIEKDGIANHASDAALYVWREARNWTETARGTSAPKTEAEIAEEEYRKMDEEAARTESERLENRLFAFTEGAFDDWT